MNKGDEENIYIHLQQRNARKNLTLVEGLPSDLDLNKILKMLKKSCNTGGAILEDNIIQLQGDQRQAVYDLFKQYEIWPAEHIKIRGF